MRTYLMFFILLSSFAFTQEMQQLAFEKNSIFVQLENLWIPTESLHVDAQGIYVTDNIRDIFHWICPKCGY